MTYRQSEYRERCQVCREESSLRCLRCGVPLCSTHYPPEDSRCDDCEDKFIALRLSHELTGKVWERNIFVSVAAIGLALPLVAATVYGLMVALISGLSAASYVWMGAFLLAWFVAIKSIRGLSDGSEVRRQLTKSRRLFLAERSEDKTSPEA